MCIRDRSIADDIKGILNFKLFDNLQSVIVLLGNMEEYWGTSVTSSKVKESLIIVIFVIIFIGFPRDGGNRGEPFLKYNSN